MASGAPVPGTWLFPLAQNFCFCLENLGSCKERGVEGVDPRPPADPILQIFFVGA